MIHRKDFNAIARGIKVIKDLEDRRRVANIIGKILRNNNPNFSWEKWDKWCDICCPLCGEPDCRGGCIINY